MAMQNKKVAAILDLVADYLEMDGVDFRTKAYRRAAHTVDFLSQPIEEVWKEGGLEKLPGIGKAIALKIEEILDTGSLQYLEDLKQQYPVDFEGLLLVEGLGPKTIKLLYQELGVKNLDDLEKAARRGHIHRLKGMGVKSEKKILENLEFARKSTGRRLLGDVLPLAWELKKRIISLPEVQIVEIAGSIRRRKETVGDIDILTVTSNPQKVMDYFVNMDLVGGIISHGPSKSTVRLKDGMEVDLRVFKKEEYGSALVYFTGSWELNVELRKIAIAQGLKLNEYGVFRGEEQLAGRTEEEVFQALGLSYIEPELRENRGEIEAAQTGELPELVEKSDIKGDLHLHTRWSDGRSSILEMAEAAQKLGYQYLAITDHAQGLPVAGGLDEIALQEQMIEIDTLNDELEDIRVLKGVELNIGVDGTIDIEEVVLEELDIVLAAIHSGVPFKPGTMTGIILDILEMEHVDILAHPSGRKLKKRPAYDIDLEKVFETAAETGTILEVDGQPKRLDLNDENIRMALKYGCRLSVDTDAHHTRDLDYMELAVSTARRGWAQAPDVVNTLPLKKLLKTLK
ncbi:DNA polymerase/3'-5' exonuclease PolX [Methanobacterium sp. CWC-01]|uniref:DNA polymerase/3'-5' exonuclease PolX n=1 Tax=Methanobacterium aridiramus TaxID=2584467 RepID=UPI003369D6FB